MGVYVCEQELTKKLYLYIFLENLVSSMFTYPNIPLTNGNFFMLRLSTYVRKSLKDLYKQTRITDFLKKTEF